MSDIDIDIKEPQSDACGCTGDTERAGHDQAYRRALWWVVILNVGFGLAELAGGFIARSQALKADSLDFLGDGTITFIGLLALGWAAVARARIALAQGIFLALLGLSVIGMAAWRALNAVPPEAELMGALGIAALAVNVTSAFILARFRERGDAQARAIWLFSRNDAINNVAVIAAAALVFWLNSAWPDLVVAAVIAVIFLHSAWEIIRHARQELGEHASLASGSSQEAGRARHHVAAALAAVTALTIDQVSKPLAHAYVGQNGPWEITSFLTMTGGRNTGVAFGLATFAHPSVLIALGIVLSAVLAFFLVRAESALEKVAFGMAMGGALANVIDRTRFGAVRDFIDLHWNDWHWPAFNFADAFVVTGLVLVILLPELRRVGKKVGAAERPLQGQEER